MAFRCFTLILFSFLIFCVSSARAEMKDYPFIRLQSLDKVTARTTSFTARVGSTLKYGPLYIRIQSCRKPPAVENPESAAFLQIWEVLPETEEQEETSQWVFSGWMFASSPALSPMDHPVYDVWVLDCLEETKKTDKGVEGEAAEPPPEPEVGESENE